MRKQLIAAFAAIGLIAGLGSTFINTPAAQALPPATSCIIKGDFAICALSTDYSAFQPGSLGGIAANILLEVRVPHTLEVTAAQIRLVGTDHQTSETPPRLDGDNQVQITQVSITDPDNAFDPNGHYFDLNQTRATDPTCNDPITGGACSFNIDSAKLHFYTNHLPLAFRNTTHSDRLDIYVQHVQQVRKDGEGNRTSDDEFKVGYTVTDRYGVTRSLYIRFDQNNYDKGSAGCQVHFGRDDNGDAKVKNFSICDERDLVGDFNQLGLGALAPIAQALPISPNGALITGTPTAIPFQPVPLLPNIPFVLLP